MNISAGVDLDVEMLALGRLGWPGLKIILLLRERGQLHVRALIREARVGYAATYRALRELEELGLVREERVRRERVLTLTERGRELADHILAAERLIAR